MKTNESKEYGFSTIAVLIVVLVTLGLGIGGWYIWQRQSNSNHYDIQAGDAKQSTNDAGSTVAQPDIYANWKTYENSTYGLLFRYPSDWKIFEPQADPSGANSPDDKSRLVQAINVLLNDNGKDSLAINVEVHDKTLNEMAAIYDSFYKNAAPDTQKSEIEIKGKDAIQYIPAKQTQGTKAYLIDVKGKTYVYTSMNEEKNASADSSYWDTFVKIFDSLTIN